MFRQVHVEPTLLHMLIVYFITLNQRLKIWLMTDSKSNCLPYANYQSAIKDRKCFHLCKLENIRRIHTYSQLPQEHIMVLQMQETNLFQWSVNDSVCTMIFNTKCPRKACLSYCYQYLQPGLSDSGDSMTLTIVLLQLLSWWGMSSVAYTVRT